MKFRIAAIIFLAATLLPVSPARAATVTVATAEDLSAAIDGARPGDVIQLEGGTYGGRWYLRNSGTKDAPITLRSAPGQWAVLDGSGPERNRTTQNDVLYVEGAHWNVEHLEVTFDATADAELGYGVNVYGRNAKLRHLVVHDTKTGFGLWAAPVETYGNLLYNNGFTNYDHSIYTNNKMGQGRSNIEHNIMLNTAAFNFHAYYEPEDDDVVNPVKNYRLTGNVATGAGLLQRPIQQRGNLIFGVHNTDQQVKDIDLERNYLYSRPQRDERPDFGYTGTGHSLRIVDNSWRLQQPFSTWRFSDVVSEVNTFAYRSRNQTLDEVAVEPVDRFEQGRGHVVVYNSAGATTVRADVDEILRPGQSYRLWNAFDIGAGPVGGGVYDGSRIAVPMDAASSAPAKPKGRSTAPPSTAPEFGVFIVRAATAWDAPALRRTQSPPPVPTNLQMAGTDATGVTMGWNRVSGAASYDIERLSDYEGGFAFSTTEGYDGNWYRAPGLEPSTHYAFRVRSRNADGVSAWTGWVGATTTPG